MKIARKIAIAVTAIACTLAHAAPTFQTRFGEISTDDEAKELLFKGTPFDSDGWIETQDDLLQLIQLKTSDVLVFRVDNGPSCSNQFFVIQASKGKVLSSPVSGGCGKAPPNVKTKGEKVLIQYTDHRGKQHTESFANGVLR